jgi:hypothetical protein
MNSNYRLEGSLFPIEEELAVPLQTDPNQAVEQPYLSRDGT